jgi:prepilin-type N-terminal cleavage/methylation domain-containing protein
MISRKGFTLIELMVVVFIVGILAAVAIPIMRGRIDAAKWSEGRAGAGSIRTAARAYCAEKGPAYPYGAGDDLAAIGFEATDLEGRYFSQSDYSIVFNGYEDYDITVTNTGGGSSGEPPTSPSQTVMTEDGSFTDTP